MVLGDAEKLLFVERRNFTAVELVASMSQIGVAANRRFPPFTLYSAKVNVSYTLDLFGANRRSLEALAAQVDYQQYEADAARLSLAGNVVTTAVRHASVAKEIALTEQIMADQNRQLDIAEQQLTGVTPGLVRLSVGIETLDDILADLDAGFRAAKSA